MVERPMVRTPKGVEAELSTKVGNALDRVGEHRRHLSRIGIGDSAHSLVFAWLAVIAACGALAVTVLLFDRTTVTGMTRGWLCSLVLSFLMIYSWWTQPRVSDRRLCINRYQFGPLILLTAPLALASLGVVGATYASDGVHAYLFSNFYYARILSNSSWPLIVPALLFAYVGIWMIRELLRRMGLTVGPKEGFLDAVAALPVLFPWGVLAFGALLATVSLSMINVNFWRYWATSDGWFVVGHYPSTLTDILHVEKGGVSKYFISFPLLPAMLSATFGLVGHNLLGAYLPLIVAGILLPLAVFLAVREATGNHWLAYLFSAFTGSFHLLRNYTIDVGEADGLLMTVAVLAAYFRLRSDRSGSSQMKQTVAGLFAGLASLARPEGALYMLAMYSCAIRDQWRKRFFWLSVFVWGVVVGVFSIVGLREFGMVWPGNHSGTLHISNFTETLRVVQQSRLFSMYASALGISEYVLTTLIALVLALVLFATVRMFKKDFGLIYMPVAALGNVVMVFFVGPIPAEAAKFHDFFRHISYGFPLLAVAVAYGIHETVDHLEGHWGVLVRRMIFLALTALIIAQLKLLAGPVMPGSPSTTPIMTSDVHVMASELLSNPYPLPVMKFRLADGRYIPDADEYMAGFPDDLDRYYAASDVRVSGDAVEYYRAATVTFLGFLLIGIFSFLPTYLARTTDRPRTSFR